MAWGRGMTPVYFHIGNKRKIEPKELPNQSIHHLLTAHNCQFEILLTGLGMTEVTGETRMTRVMK